MPSASSHPVRHPLSKVPEITAFFWIIKILTTGMGETTSDFLAHTLNPIFAVGIGAAGLVIALSLQFIVRRYVAWVYWLAVVMVSVFGTMAADVLHVGFGIPYIVSSLFYAVVLACVFVVWFVREKTLSIHRIYTRHREFFYWATVLATFALGTAVGDLTAVTLHLGYLTSGILFAILFIVPLVAQVRFGANEIFTFWFAYIVTRPFGASFADWMGVSLARGGLGWGTGPVSLALAVLIALFVGYLSFSRKDIERATH
jgi:uncharacterized membrane-anchored protein